MVTKQSKENEVYMKKTTLEEKLGYNQKGAKKELKIEPIERQIYYSYKCIRRVKLMEGFDLSRKQIQRLIKDMREEGLVERRGSNRNGKWIAKK